MTLVNKVCLGLGCLLGCIPLMGTTASVDPAHDMSVAQTHWAFVPLAKPEIPATPTSFDGNQVDAFIWAKLQEKQLNFNEEADKRSLIRRVTYDLTGLPPTFDEVEAFVADGSKDAYEKLVERLLASPAYGERWARHWLDVARYADSMGIFRRGRYPFSYTYRDYVIQAFNEDKPYDQFILEQIAADQLDLGKDKSALAGMGFLTLGRTFFGRKDYIIDDQIDVITRGLQGLTVTCARCHDHKFDPIPTSDYYSLHGIFASSENPDVLPIIKYPDSEADYGSYLLEKQRIQREIDKKSEEEVDKFIKEERLLAGNYLKAVEGARSIKDFDDLEVYAGSIKTRAEVLRLWVDYMESGEARKEPVLQKWFSEYADKDPEAGRIFYNDWFKEAIEDKTGGHADVKAFLNDPDSPLNPDRDDVATWIRRKIGGVIGELSGEMTALAWTHPGSPMRAHILADVEKPKNSPIYKRGDPGNKGEEVPRQYLQILEGDHRKPFTDGSGRLQLAEEIASEDNPLTARVYVNRLWGWHTGTPIVDTPSDFGVRTPEPVQLDLLNWLAATFIESEWSTKAIHRLIVLSKTYRQSSSPATRSVEVDPSNTLWHHYPKQRLDFESMRDTVLAVAGNLDRTMGGLQVDITDPTTNRRTVYAYIDRRDVPGLFRTFDHPSPEATSPGRFETVVPQQALFMMNSPFVIHQARHLAGRLEAEAGSDPQAKIERCYEILFQRPASPEEVQAGIEFIEEFQAEKPAPLEEGEESQEALNKWELYSQVLLLSNELMFLD
ncbi:MAG: DUF1549 domain-containing protein [Verrucomicrobiae bacterium]|nr:DUF1549 domain-containing protein [Verrucomicrobiae bacterium]